MKLVGTICDYSVVIDEFNVTFGEPLSLAWNSKEVKLKAGRESSESISWTSALTLKEAYGEKRLIIGTKDKKPVINTDLKKWYVVGTPVVDVTKAKVNGIEIAECTDDKGKALYNLTFSPSEDAKGGEFAFKYNGRGYLEKALTITVPVTVSSKWQTWTETITISVPKAE